jgi:hypothetical protein
MDGNLHWCPATDVKLPDGFLEKVGKSSPMAESDHEPPALMLVVPAGDVAKPGRGADVEDRIPADIQRHTAIVLKPERVAGGTEMRVVRRDGYLLRRGKRCSAGLGADAELQRPLAIEGGTRGLGCPNWRGPQSDVCGQER